MDTDGGAPQHDLPWAVARDRASSVPRLAGTTVRVGAALGRVLAADVRAVVDLPPSAVSAMDGWAVAGPGPWRLDGRQLAGQLGAPLAPGVARVVGTGTWLPEGADAVVRREHGHVVDGVLTAAAPEPGKDARPRGQEARAGDALVRAGALVTPAVVALASAAGLDTLEVVPAPEVAVLVLGDELLLDGPPREGRVRDALGPALPAWLAGYGAQVVAVEHVPDVAEVLAQRLAALDVPLVVTTGSTAAGPVDHLHAVLAQAGARLLVDGVRVRPGHPMLLAERGPGRWLVGLPGNPLAAVTGLATLVGPLLGALSGWTVPSGEALLAADVTGHPTDTRVLPLRAGHPSLHAGPAMLRGLVEADALAVVPPGGARAGRLVEALALPWARDPFPARPGWLVG